MEVYALRAVELPLPIEGPQLGAGREDLVHDQEIEHLLQVAFDLRPPPLLPEEAAEGEAAQELLDHDVPRPEGRAWVRRRGEVQLDVLHPAGFPPLLGHLPRDAFEVGDRVVVFLSELGQISDLLDRPPPHLPADPVGVGNHQVVIVSLLDWYLGQNHGWPSA